MISFSAIGTIARYERTTLQRSWFLRVFLFLGLILLFFVNLFLVTGVQESPSWEWVALPASIPYRNLLYINLAQSVVAVFLAADFLRRDRNLDTAEVVYTRPVSNHEYVLGKAWANLLVFLVTDLLLMAVVTVFNIISGQASLDVAAYFEYLLFLVLPTLLFIVGLAFLLMTLLRNQAVTFLLVLGYLALVLFYLKGRAGGLFDFSGWEMPMLKSGITGFDRWEDFLFQRLFYSFLGVSFVFLTVFLLRRLPAAGWERVVSLGLAFFFLAAAGGAAWQHLYLRQEERELRARLLGLNDAYARRPALSVKEHRIGLRHQGRHLALTSHMLLVNDNDTVVDRVVLSLNPGLHVSSLAAGGKKVAWQRRLHLLLVTPPHPLRPGDTLSLDLRYAGTIDDRICYPDIDTFRMPHLLGGVKVASSFAFVTPDYVLLTPETLWYPVTGTTYSPRHPGWFRKDFIRFRLHVEGIDSSRVISQGTARREGDGITFICDTLLPQISLAIGDYVEHRLTVDSLPTPSDSILFRVFTLRGHDYFVGSLPRLDNDTIRKILRERMQEYENKLGLHYPFRTFSLVEVPIQFHSYQHLWMGAMENVQPAIVFMEEKGAAHYQANFSGYFENLKRWSRWSREKRTEKEMMGTVLNSFFYLFLTETVQYNLRRVAGGAGALNSRPNELNIFPEYFDHRFFLSSSSWPVMNRVMEAYLKVPWVGTGNDWVRRYTGLSEDERANMALQNKSFRELLTTPSGQDILDNVIRLKGEMFFLAVKAHLEEEEVLDTFLHRWLEQRWFSKVPFDTLLEDLEQLSGYPLGKYLENWYSGKSLPAYLFSQARFTRVTEEGYVRWLFSVTIANKGEGSGAVRILFEGLDPPVEHVVWFGARQARRIRYLVDGTRGGVTYVTMVSRNIPMILYEDPVVDHTVLTYPPERGSVTFPADQFRYIPEGTLLVDNEDPGFSLTEPGNEGLFYRLLVKSKQQGKKYSGFSWWRPINWTLTTSNAFYGRFVRSAWFVRAGEGKKKATWKVPVPEAGYYTVYYYLDYRKFRWNNRRGDNRYEFRIRHGDVVDETSLVLRGSSPGWNSLGFYYFPADTAVIELSDKTGYWIVVADAVKLMKE